MVYQFLRKAACFSEGSPHTMSYAAVLSFYSNGIFFPYKMIASLKSGQQTLPIFGADTINSKCKEFTLNALTVFKLRFSHT